jgi:hypothetical protein
MDAKTVYSDLGATTKRDLAEDGVEAVDGPYHRAEARDVRLAFPFGTWERSSGPS